MLAAAAAMTMNTNMDVATTNNNNNLEERLSELLSSPNNFSAAQYLNLALSTDGDTVVATNSNNAAAAAAIDEYQILERRMASTALQLQMRTRSCHDEISRIGAELHAIIPRCAADISRLRSGMDGMEMDVRGMLLWQQEEGSGNGSGGDVVAGGTKLLGKYKNKKNTTIEELMDNVSINTGNDNNTTNPLATLRTLLTLRAHLTSTRSILAAASGWDDTMDSVPSLLATNPPDLYGAVNALVRLEAGSRALHCVPGGREERDVSLRKLRTQIEAMLRPRLHHALGNMESRLGPLRQCVEMYTALGRMETLRMEYVRLRPAEIHALWFSFGGGGGGGGSTSTVAGSSKRRVAGNYDGEMVDKSSVAGTTVKDEEVKDFDFNEDHEDDDTGTMSKTQHHTTAAPTAKQFIDFLPTFYDAVLELLSKERTQSRAVFGPDVSSSVMASVLTECFRPIVASFGKRLNSVCPAPGKGVSKIGSGSVDNGGVGGMEAIGAAYESTIRFLSLAYDQMEAWDGHSLKDKRSLGGKDTQAAKNESLHLIRSSFLLIASPFVQYQRALAEAERDPMGEAAIMVAKDVRGVVNFEDAAERFEYLAPFIFPLAEGEDDNKGEHP